MVGRPAHRAGRAVGQRAGQLTGDVGEAPLEQLHLVVGRRPGLADRLLGTERQLVELGLHGGGGCGGFRPRHQLVSALTERFQAGAGDRGGHDGRLLGLDALVATGCGPLGIDRGSFGLGSHLHVSGHLRRHLGGELSALPERLEGGNRAAHGVACSQHRLGGRSRPDVPAADADDGGDRRLGHADRRFGDRRQPPG